LDTFVERGDRYSRNEYNIAHAIATLWGGKSEEAWSLELSTFLLWRSLRFRALVD
jgi:hypothetical protein